MSTGLPEKYVAARQALSAASRVDEVKNIRDKAVAMAVYAKQAKDGELIGFATEIKKRAERRLGEVMAEQPKAKGAAQKGIGKRGKNGQERGVPETPRLIDQNIDKNLAKRARKAAEMPKDKFEAAIVVACDKAVAIVEGRQKPKGALGNGENEWYTPKDELGWAREVLGGFDLDPATSDQAQKTVKAAKYFTKDDDGLTKEWHGRVWLNPPYTQPEIADFVKKLVEEVKSGNVTEAILLTHNYTDTEWFRAGEAACQAICFTKRIKFVKANGEIAAPTQGQAFFYFGKKLKKFAEVFETAGGFVMVPFTK